VDIRIDRIRLQAPGMPPEAARELGRLLAEHLAAALAVAPPGPELAQRALLAVSVPWPAGQEPGRVRPVTAAAAAAPPVCRALRGAAGGPRPVTG
jgi:hypothetical protein